MHLLTECIQTCILCIHYDKDVNKLCKTLKLAKI